MIDYRKATTLLGAILFFASLGRAQVDDSYLDPNMDIEDRVELLLSQMTLEEKLDMLGGYEAFYIKPNGRLGIPKIKMADGPLGIRNYGKATAFPAAIAFTASWNVDLMGRYGSAVGKECRSKGVHILLAPGLNIHRAPMCGRNFEYLGEDPYLAARMAVAYVKGIQGEGVVATAKHFVANNQEYDRHRVSSDVDERALREIYLPAFKSAVVEAKIGAIMTAYNLVNGIHCSENEFLIRHVLKGDWKFDGIVMSDWGSTYDTVAAANAGLDLEMPWGAHMNRENLIPAIEAGEVSLETVDDKVRRILRVLFRMSFFDRPQVEPDLPLYSPESRLVALEGAREGAVLLKNDRGVLPLERKAIRSIAVFGPNVHPAVTGGGGSSRVRPFRSVSILEGLVQTAGDEIEVYYNPGIITDFEDFYSNSRFYTSSPDEPGKEIAGLTGEYFANTELCGEALFTRIDRRVDFRWEGAPAGGLSSENFSSRWIGKIRADGAGVYRFVVCGDDGFRLFVNGDKVLDEWRDQSATTCSAQLYLEGGRFHDVVLEYYQNRGSAEIRFGWIPPGDTNVEEAIRLAEKADAAVVCVGFNADVEREGEDRTFELPPGQEELLKEIAAVNKNTIVVLIAGGNVAMEGWLEDVAALLHCWYPGQEGGAAVAEIIFGDINPSGKLPVSFERRWEDNAAFGSYYDRDGDKRVKYSEGIFLGYRHFDRSGIDPLFPFGFGLSYTSFEYDNLQFSNEEIASGETLVVSCDISNSGKREGAEIVQLYIRDPQAGIPRPEKELKGFCKVFLEPGESKTVTFEIGPKALSYYDAENWSWVVEPGDFEVQIGSSSRDIRLRRSFVCLR